MGGEIAVRSEEGKGSVFAFTVTIARQPSDGDMGKTMERMLALLKRIA